MATGLGRTISGKHGLGMAKSGDLRRDRAPPSPSNSTAEGGATAIRLERGEFDARVDISTLELDMWRWLNVWWIQFARSAAARGRLSEPRENLWIQLHHRSTRKRTVPLPVPTERRSRSRTHGTTSRPLQAATRRHGLVVAAWFARA